MCGKFTAMASWSEVVDFSQALSVPAGSNDRVETFRVMSDVRMIVFDREANRRRVVPMRWGFPKPGNWRVPQPIHARSEAIDATHPHKYAFIDGRRGIVLVKTFNEAPDVPGKSEQHLITPGDATPLGLAFVWDRFQIEELAVPLLACVMVTVSANALIATLPTDRMPAVLANDHWAAWLGESDADAKATLKTVDGVGWTMIRERPERQPSLF